MGIILYDKWNLSYGNVMAFGRSDRWTRQTACRLALGLRFEPGEIRCAPYFQYI